MTIFLILYEGAAKRLVIDDLEWRGPLTCPKVRDFRDRQIIHERRLIKR